MPSNEQLARLLDAKADELGAEGANPYRIRAYRRAARGSNYRAIRMDARRSFSSGRACT